MKKLKVTSILPRRSDRDVPEDRGPRTRWRAMVRWVPALCFSALLAGCGGGGSGDDSGGGVIGTGIQIDGTAAPNRMLARNNVEIRTKTGQRFTTPITSNGEFQTSLADAEAPLLMRIDLGNGDFQYSLIAADIPSTDVDQNVHGYTDLVARNWFASRGLDIDSEFSSGAELSQTPLVNDLVGIRQVFFGTLDDVLAAYGLTGVDLSSGKFITNDSGINDFLVSNPVVINNGTINIFINDPVSNTQSVAVEDLPISTDLAVSDDQAPSVPANVRALAANESDIVVVWEPSTDNIGVSEYQIFRDGELIATTPFPVYSDEGLSSGQSFSYAIVALDAAGNESAASDLQTSSTLNAPDTIAPLAPQGLILSADNQSVSVLWGHADISDVVSFRVERTTGSEQPVLASVTATFFVDAPLMSGTEYCYTIFALDGSGNESAPSATECTSTTGIAIVPDNDGSQIPGSGTGSGSETPPVTGGVDTLSISAPVFQVLESSPSVTISVERIGSSAGQVSVSYSVIGDTAIDGEDFSATSGTLTWDAGDTAPKSFTVQIASDGLTEGDETFQVILSDASGNAMLGDNAVAVVTITDVAADVCSTVLEITEISENTTLGLPCYLLNSNLRVLSGTLTIEPGVMLKFASGTYFEVRSGGTLEAEATADAPIVITSQDGFPGTWGGVAFNSTPSPRNSLSHVVIEDGGSSFRTRDSNLLVGGSSRVSIDNVIVRNSFNTGFHVERGAGLISFENIISTNNAKAGAIGWGNLPSISGENDFSGNESDVLDILNDSNILEPAIWPTVNIPMLFSAQVRTFAALSISEGNTLLFSSSAGIRMSTGSSFTAVGTAAAPIVFTGEQPVPGIWRGIDFDSDSLPSEIRFATVEFGGQSELDGNVSIRCGVTTGLSISDSAFNNSAGFGIYRNADTCTLDIGDNVSFSGNAFGGIREF